MDSARRTQKDAAWDQFTFQTRDDGSSPPLLRSRMARLRSFEYDQNLQQFLSDNEEKEDEVRADYFSDCLRLDDASDFQQPGSHQRVEENYFSKHRGLKPIQKQKTNGLVREYKEKFENYWTHDNNHGVNHNLNQHAMNEKYPRNEQSTGRIYSSNRQTLELHSDLLPRDFNAEPSLLSPDFRTEGSSFPGFRSDMESPLLSGNFTSDLCNAATNTEPLSLNDDFSSLTNNSGPCSSWIFEPTGYIGGGAVPKKKKNKSRHRDTPVSTFAFPASPGADQFVFSGASAQIDVGREVHGRKDIGCRSVVEVEGKLHGLVPVLIPLRQLSTEKKRQIANSCWTATCGNSPNVGQQHLQDVGQADVSGSGRSVYLLLSNQCLQLTAPPEPGCTEETELATHNLRRLGLFHGYPDHSNTLVYAGHSDLGGRMAVIITLCNYEHYTCVMEHLKMNTGSSRSKKM